MTPRRLDRAMVIQRLREIELLRTDLAELGAVDAERLPRERPTRHIVERVLSQIVELAGSINLHVATSLSMRTVLVRDYLDVDHDMVSIAIPLAQEQYREYVRNIARWRGITPAEVQASSSKSAEHAFPAHV